MSVTPKTTLEFRDAVNFVAYHLERGELSRTTAAADLRRLVLGHALYERERERLERLSNERERERLERLSERAKPPVDLGVARFAREAIEGMMR